MIDVEVFLFEIWIDLLVRLCDLLDKVNEYCQNDEQFVLFLNNSVIELYVMFGIKVVGFDNIIFVIVSNGYLSI